MKAAIFKGGMAEGDVRPDYRDRWGETLEKSNIYLLSMSIFIA
jgi:hypothetical protein